MLLALLQRADIFWARPTYLSPTPRKETRKRAVYQIPCTHTQEGPWHSAKIIADADDICSRKTGLRTFWKCFLEKKRWTISTSRERSRCHATNTISAWSFLMAESGKKTFSSLIFWKRDTVNEFYGTIDISFQMKETEFSVIHGLEKAKLLHTGTCTSTCTRHVN